LAELENLTSLSLTPLPEGEGDTEELQSQITDNPALPAGRQLLIAELQKQMKEIEDLINDNASLINSNTDSIITNLDLINTNINSIAELKDAVGLLDGKLEMDEIVAGAFTVKVAEDKPTIGEAVICGIVPVDKDNDHIDDCSGNAIPQGENNDKDEDWIDDDTEEPIVNDGATAIIKTEAVSENSKVFVTSKDVTDQPLAVTKIVSGESFEVEIKRPTSKSISFDWWIVEAE
jgi:hypothetical protein